MSGEVVPVVVGELVGPATTPSTEHQLYDLWLERQKSDHTREAYRRDFGYWADFLDDRGVEVLAANGGHATLYQRELERTPLASTGKPPKPATVARRLAVVSSYYKLAVKVEILARNPVDFLDRPELDPDNSETAGLTEDEARRVIAAAFGYVATAKGPDTRRVADRDSVMVAVMLTTGLRVSELCSVQLEDLGYDRGHRVVRVTRKGGKRQALPLGPAARLVDERIAGDKRTSGPLFTTRNGRPVVRSTVARQLERVAKAASIPAPWRVTPHALRHTYATLALDNGATLDELQDALGHADPRTSRRYDRARNRIDRSPTHTIGALLLGDQPQQRERLF